MALAALTVRGEEQASFQAGDLEFFESSVRPLLVEKWWQKRRRRSLLPWVSYSGNTVAVDNPVARAGWAKE